MHFHALVYRWYLEIVQIKNQHVLKNLLVF
jgi:hypothetical protein